ncbi:MAG: hypothetical protein JWN18_327 [Parcubacteria group bacterium]|nr:hypothetical protein [Parcubacteria group bacterium]
MSHLPTFAPWALGHFDLKAPLDRYGAIILREMVPKEVAQQAYLQARIAFADPGAYIARPEAHPQARSGYTPPNVEGKMGQGPNPHRHFFDYRPGRRSLAPGKDVLVPLHRALCRVAKIALREIDHVARRRFSSMMDYPRATLRAAECLNDFVDPGFELFPSHRDFSFLTLFVGGAQSGLQVEQVVRGEKKWIDVTLPFGDVLIGIGTIYHQYFPQAVPLQHRIVASSPYRLSFFSVIDPRKHVLLPNGELASQFFARVMAQVRYKR